MTTEQIWERIGGGNRIIPEQYKSQLQELEAQGRIKLGERALLPPLDGLGKANPNYGIKVSIITVTEAYLV